MNGQKRYKVVQWATGNIGTRALKAVIEHPDMDLVGLYVSSPEKHGRDAGEIAGTGRTGVIATGSLDNIVATDADAVLYMRQGIDFDEVCALLESGKNIVTTRGEFHYPPGMDATLRERVEAACRAGNASIYSTGSSPGFISEALVIPLLSQQRRLDCMTIDEYADCSSRNSPDMLFNIMGFGGDPEQLSKAGGDHVKYGFAATFSQIADAIGRPVERFETKSEVGVAMKDVHIAAGIVPKGTVGAMRSTLDVISSGQTIIRFRTNWYVTRDIDQDWELRDSGWRVQIAGDAPHDISIGFPVSKEEYPNMTPGLTAHRPVNSIPAVCAAEPGIRTTVDLPHIIARL